MTPAKPPFPSFAALSAALNGETPDWKPVLTAVEGVDRVLRRTGLLGESDSLALRLPWWPTVVITGPDPAVRRSFIESWLGTPAEAEETDAARTITSPKINGLTLVDSPTADDADAVLIVLGPATEESIAAAKDTLTKTEREHRVLIRVGVDTPLPDAEPDPTPDAWRQALLPDSDEPILIRRAESDDEAIVRCLDSVRNAARSRFLEQIEIALSAIDGEVVPLVAKRLRLWRRLVLITDAAWIALLAVVAIAIVRSVGNDAVAPFFGWLFEVRPDRLGGLLPLRAVIAAAIPVGLVVAGHLWLRAALRRRLANGLAETTGDAEVRPRDAFLRGAAPLRPLLAKEPKGWHGRGQRRFAALRSDLAKLAALPTPAP